MPNGTPVKFEIFRWLPPTPKDLSLDVRLFTNTIADEAEVEAADFVEPPFSGYRVFPAPVWLRKAEMTGPRSLIIRSKKLLWVASSDNASLPVRGFFVQLNTTSWPIVVAFRNFPGPVNMQQHKKSIGLIVQIRSFVQNLE